MHDFHVSKVSGANSVLDIYLDKPKSSKKSSKRSVSTYFENDMILLRYIKQIFSVKNPNSNRIFSVEHRLFKSFIFGGIGTFQKFYFRQCNNFNLIVKCLARIIIFINNYILSYLLYDFCHIIIVSI